MQFKDHEAKSDPRREQIQEDGIATKRHKELKENWVFRLSFLSRGGFAIAHPKLEILTLM